MMASCSAYSWRPKMEATCSFERLDDFNRTIRRYRSRDIAVGIATDYRLDDGGVGIRVPERSRIFSSPRRPDLFRGPPSLLSNKYQGRFPQGYSGRGVKLTIHLQLVQRSKKVWIYIRWIYQSQHNYIQIDYKSDSISSYMFRPFGHHRAIHVNTICH
jgi:hypothetical protein